MSRGGGKKIIPLSEDEAKNWAEKYIKIFGGDEEFFEIFSKTQKLAQFPCFDEDEYNRITEHLQSEKVLMVFKKEKPVAVLLSLEEYQNRSE